MRSSREVIAVIPCRNEAANIASVVKATLAHVGHALVVDDGSTDATADRAIEAGAEVLRGETDPGKGAALRAGLRAAIERGFRQALTLDGDGQHRPGDIPRFFLHRPPPIGGGRRLVIGNRMDSAHSMPPLRRATNTAMSRALSLATGRILPDTQCGFRLMDLDPAFVDRLAADHFETESDQIAVALELGWAISFVPVACVYRGGVSAIRPVRDGARWMKWFFGKRRVFANVRPQSSPQAIPPSHSAHA